MTNAEIIFNNRLFLMEQGVIKGTGVMIEVVDDNGKRTVEMPEEIHTFNGWRRLGYSVKKGEHTVARFPIWKQIAKGKAGKDTDADADEEKTDGGNGFCGFYMKMSFFFTRDQVEPLKK